MIHSGVLKALAARVTGPKSRIRAEVPVTQARPQLCCWCLPQALRGSRVSKGGRQRDSFIPHELFRFLNSCGISPLQEEERRVLSRGQPSVPWRWGVGVWVQTWGQSAMSFVQAGRRYCGGRGFLASEPEQSTSHKVRGKYSSHFRLESRNERVNERTEERARQTEQRQRRDTLLRLHITLRIISNVKILVKT